MRQRNVPFRIDVPESLLADLWDRIDRARWPDEVEDAGWDYGTSERYLRELTGYWRTSFDWRAQERALNAVPMFRADVDGFGLHFVHAPGVGPDPLPLLLVHGWPSTFAEMIEVVGPLSDPAAHGGDPVDAFDVVVPSLPGFGFSDRPSRRGMNVDRISELLVELMLELGYDRFAVQGGDWGSSIANWIAYAHAPHVVGISLTQLIRRRVRRSAGANASRRPTPSGAVTLMSVHSVLNRLAPQTMSYALNDSPVGLAATIVEKYRLWGDPADGVHTFEDVYTKDEMLTNVMIYWVTQTAASAARIYYENARTPSHLPEGRRIEVPMGAFLPCRPDGSYESREEQSYNYADIRRWTLAATPGHFLALERPDELVAEIRALFRPLRGGASP